MKNKKIVIFAIVIIVVIAIIAGALYIVNRNTPKPEEALSAYISLLNEQKYEEMYNMISEYSKTQISQEDFIKRNKNIYEGIDAYDIKVTPSETTKDGKTYSIKYNESMSTSAGTISFENIAKLVRKNKEYKISWTSSMIFPELRNTDKVRVSTLSAKRGEILDRSGSVLATTTSSFNIEMYKTKSDDETLNKCILNIINLFENNQVGYPNNFPVNDECTSYTIEGDTLKKWLAKYKLAENTSVEDTIAYFVKRYGITSENIKEARKIISIRYEMSTKGYSSTKPLSLAENVSRNVVAQISERNSDFPGVTITTQSSRKYNYGSLASHILGYIGKISEKEYNEEQDVYENDDYVGRTGIESLFENYLRGKKGKEEIEMTVDGTVTGETVTKAPEQGSTVVLTIDSKLQEVAETALKNNIEKIRSV